jgi:hypothetical protein
MTMTIRERLMATLRGGAPDRIPWNIYTHLLPQTEAGRELHARGLGFMSGCVPFRTIPEQVTIRENQSQVGGLPLIQKTIETPAGTLTEEAVIEPHHGSRWIRKFFVAGPADYPAAEFYFRHTRFEPEYEPWRQANAAMGEEGVVAASIMALPILVLMQDWMGVEGAAEGIYLHTGGFDALIDALGQHYQRQAELAAGSPAELVWFPESLTATIISPQLFRRYCAPVYARAVPVVRGAGKLITAHYDGSIRPLVDLLGQVDIPIIEAFTPPPMGDLTVAEAKAAWPHKVIWVNFPGSLFHETAETIYTYTMQLLETGAPGGRLVMGCTEDFPIDQFAKTFSAIGRALAAYEGYAWPGP